MVCMMCNQRSVNELSVCLLQPGVADSEMEQLIADRVDVLWKGIENGTNKRGQVSTISIVHHQIVTYFYR